MYQRRILSLCLGAIVFAGTFTGGRAANTQGTRFAVAAFAADPGPPNGESGFSLFLQNSNSDAVGVVVWARRLTGREIIGNVTVQPRNTTVVRVPSRFIVSISKGETVMVTYQGLMVDSTAPISVSAEVLDRLHEWPYSAAFLVLPTSALGTRYYPVAQEAYLFSVKNMAVVVATEANTTVTIPRLNRVIMLDELDTLTLGYRFTKDGKISGMEIVADKPVAVVSGSSCGSGIGSPGFYSCGSAHALMLTPVDSWATDTPFTSYYAQAPFPNNSYNYFHLTAAEHDTLVTLGTERVARLRKGQVLETRRILGHNQGVISASKPIQLVQFGMLHCANESHCINVLNRNTFAVHVPPISQYTSGGVFLSTVSDAIPYKNHIWTSIIRLISERACLPHFTLDGHRISPIWMTLVDNKWYYTDIFVQPGSHFISCDVDNGKYLPVVSGSNLMVGYAKIGQLNLGSMTTPTTTTTSRATMPTSSTTTRTGTDTPTSTTPPVHHGNNGPAQSVLSVMLLGLMLFTALIKGMP